MCDEARQSRILITSGIALHFPFRAIHQRWAVGLPTFKD